MVKKLLLLSVILASLLSAVPAQAHAPTNPYPRVADWENYYLSHGYNLSQSRCYGAMVAAWERNPNGWDTGNTGGWFCRGQVYNGDGSNARIGISCPFGPCGYDPYLGRPYPARSVNIGNDYIMNRFSDATNRRGLMYFAVTHETAHNWLYAICGGDPSCGTGEGECYADYTAHWQFDARPRYYSSYKDFCTNPARNYDQYWVTAYE